MVQFIVDGEDDPLLRVVLDKGDAVAAESNAMVSMDRCLSLKGKARGGVMSAIARKLFNEETFFQQYVEAEDRGGEALLAPNLPGGIRVLPVGAAQYCIADGCWLASTSGVELEMKAQGIGKSLFGGTGGFLVMKTSGQGEVVVSGFGSLRVVNVSPDRPVNVDNGHVVAWDAGLDYELTLNASRSGLLGKLVQSQISGEKIMLKFSGAGKVIVCSRNKGTFVDWILMQQPDRQGNDK